MRITDTRIYFWASILGNWTKVKGGIIVPGEYEPEGKEFNLPTSEHVFMYLKAWFFKDLDTAKLIRETENPKEAKNLGRQVKGFNENAWEKYREEAMMTALRLRYKYDEKFRSYLHRPEFIGKSFVEANPYDKVWSCGWIETDPRCDLPEICWPGLNLLGKLLSKLRDETAI